VAEDRLREEEDEAAKTTPEQARLFDVRRVIGGLFIVYGVIVGVMGLFDSTAQLRKAQNVNINLWTGVIMLVLGVLFLLWQWWRPAQAPPRSEAKR
jgi:protein-S-isoprenylcysteine O-methyltransferase Ste14